MYLNKEMGAVCYGIFCGFSIYVSRGLEQDSVLSVAFSQGRIHILVDIFFLKQCHVNDLSHVFCHTRGCMVGFAGFEPLIDCFVNHVVMRLQCVIHPLSLGDQVACRFLLFKSAKVFSETLSLPGLVLSVLLRVISDLESVVAHQCPDGLQGLGTRQLAPLWSIYTFCCQFG